MPHGPMYTTSGLKVQIRWSSFKNCKETLEPVNMVYEDVPKLFKKLIARKNTPRNLKKIGLDFLGIYM